MSQATTKITLICEPTIEVDIETALANSGIQFEKEEVEEPTKAYVLYIPEDSFVFVIGALIGYIFAFLQRFLGILGNSN